MDLEISQIMLLSRIDIKLTESHDGEYWRKPQRLITLS